MAQPIVPRVAFDLPHLPLDHKLTPILSAALEDQGRGGAPLPPHLARVWEPSQFGLDKCGLYTNASEDDRRAILALCARDTLEEAYFIEKSGLAYTGKMILVSETTEERMLYALFGADEATHLRAISAWLPDARPTRAESPFLSLLADVIEGGERDTLVFVVQVVLEGWGITHYGDIARACKSDGLRRALLSIVKDEALHHGSGLQLWASRPCAPRAEAEILEVLVRFLGMVQAGPQGVLSALSRVLGDLGPSDRRHAYEELGGQAHGAVRLELLKRLMEKAGAHAIVEQLEARGAFVPYRAEEAA